MLAIAVWLLPPLWSAPLVAAAVVALALGVRPQPGGAPSTTMAKVHAADHDRRSLIAPLAEGVLLLDGARAVVAANRAAAGILGRPFEGLAGASLITATRDHDLAEIARAASGVAVPVHLSATGHDLVATATEVDAGAVRTLLVMQDITELERARRARADLVANMSHELRTPIAAARALAETLQSGVDDEVERTRFLDRLEGEIARLGEMVERLLRLSRLESGTESFTTSPLDVGALLTTAAERMEPLARQYDVRIAVMLADTPLVIGDRDRVLEVLSNLLDNALKHSPAGLHIGLSAHLDDEQAGRVRLEVDDDGPGILPSDRERVFERFYTGDRARGSGGGTGLGLAIARHIVQRLGGRIWVADRSPGATLCFTLPVAEATDAPR